MRRSDRLIARTYRHDISGPLQILSISADRDDPVDVLGVEEMDMEPRAEMEEFIGILHATVERLNVSPDPGFVEPDIRALGEYEGNFEGRVGEYVDNVADISSLILPYVEATGEGYEDEVAIGEVLEPLEGGANIEYNGLGGARVQGDRGLCVIANTVALNARDHGDNADLWAEVEELGDGYRIHIWDDGPGLSDEYGSEEIYGVGNGDNSGEGLYLARELSELFGGSLEFSEEYAEREDGFAQTLTLRKPDQYSTPESEYRV